MADESAEKRAAMFEAMREVSTDANANISWVIEKDATGKVLALTVRVCDCEELSSLIRWLESETDSKVLE